MKEDYKKEVSNEKRRGKKGKGTIPQQIEERTVFESVKNK